MGGDILGNIYCIYYKKRPIYVGQTIKNIEERWKEHLTEVRLNRGFAIHHFIRSKNIQDFTIELLEKTENLNEAEKKWIKKLHTHISEQGYNLTQGGETCSEKLKIPCYQYNLDGNFLQSYESISAAARAVGGSTGNLTKAIYGKIHQAYGFRWSNEKMDNIGPLPNNYTGVAKPIYQYDLEGNFIRSYQSSKEAGRILKKSQGNISSAANGKRKTAYGYKWSYDYIMNKAYGW